MCRCPHPALCECERKDGVLVVSAIVATGYLSALGRDYIISQRHLYIETDVERLLSTNYCAVILPVILVLLTQVN